MKQNKIGEKMARFGRLHELSQLESVIEQKKREIQEKQEAQKKKETEEALKKIQEKSADPPRRPFWQRGKGSSQEKKEKEALSAPPISNVFSNDGSFLEQYRQLSRSGLKPDKIDVETLAKAREAEEKEKQRKKAVEEEKHQRQIEREVKEREREFRLMARMNNPKGIENKLRAISVPEESSSKRNSLESNIKLNLPPPGVVQFVQQVPVLPPMVIAPVTQLVLNTPPAPTFTTNQIQLQAAGLAPPSLSAFGTPLPSSPYEPPLVTGIPTPQPMSPQTIPPPKPLQVEAIPPPPWPHPVDDIPPPPKRKKKTATCQPRPDDFDIPLPDSIPLPKASGQTGTLPENVRHLAKMVAYSGDHAEEILRVSHADDPTLRFLSDQNSTQYREFRICVESYRRGDYGDSDNGSKADSDDEEDSNGGTGGCGGGGEKYDPADADTSDTDEDSSSAEKLKRFSKSNKMGEDKYDPTEIDSDSSDTMDSKPKSFFDQIKTEPSEMGSDTGSIPFFEAHSKEAESKTFIPFLGIGQSNSSVKEEKYDGFDLGNRPSFQGASSSSENQSGVSFVKAEGEDGSKRKRKSRWGNEPVQNVPPITMAVPSALGAAPAPAPQLPPGVAPVTPLLGSPMMLSQVTRRDPGLVAYARQNFGSGNLSDEDWKKAEDHYKINLLYQEMMKKKEQIDKLARSGKFKYEYDSDEETEGGTWEHKLRTQEMQATKLWADELTRQSEGKHHIGDFLPPDELKRFMEKYDSVKTGREPDLSDYKEFKLQENNVGYQLLQKMGWSEGQGLGQQNQGIVNPVNKASSRLENQGLGVDLPDGLDANDDEYDAYRKRMMLAYRFRPNPLNNPRRPYY